MKKMMLALKNLLQSGFLRSVFMRVLSIFIVVSIAVAAIVFYAFTSEISRNMISERQKQLESVEKTISTRMSEITSIAYNISTDNAFLLESVAGSGHTGYEMSNTLSRYLVGNSFIEHLAFYRMSEPDTIYVSSGERSLTEFFSSSFGLSEEAAKANIAAIRSSKTTDIRVISYADGNAAFFSYLYPLPPLSANPKAFVLMLIPTDGLSTLMEPFLADENSGFAAFDANGKEIYHAGTLDNDFPYSDYVADGIAAEEHITFEGTRYILQKVVSDDNGWTYISVMREADTLSGLANKQLLVLFMLVFLIFLAIIAMFVIIIKQYQPISNLAAAVADEHTNEGHLADERDVLTSAIASLKDDSEQKQRFESAYHEAEAASRAKSAFLSNMSHDIRTPMNAVIGMTSLALRHADDPEYVRTCLAKVQTSSGYLLDIINNVLDMSRIESGRVKLSENPVDLPALMESLSALIEPGIAAKNQKLIVDVGTFADGTVMGDSVRLTQVFMNILSNAVKFTPDGGTISIVARQVECADAGFSRYVFKFSDSGVGIPPEFLGQVFDTFTRADETSGIRSEGTGLGMAIAKSLVELMGGEIAVESEIGIGTTFTVSLRLAPAERASESEKDGEQRSEAVIDLSGKHILLAEDNAINREIATMIINETNAEVTEAVNGRDAIAAFLARPTGYFDMILMDIQMPEMDGYDATAGIRSADRADAAAIPIYAMTANTFDEDVRRVREAGMDGHIGKPYTPETLYAVIKKALKL